MKVIFLDVDGVLNCYEFLSLNREEIDSNKVKLLSEIVNATGAKIVLSSTWIELSDDKDEDEGYRYLVNKLKEYNLTIFDHTPILDFCRPKEISTWLKSHKNCNKFVSLDDDFREWQYEEYGIGNCLVSTNFWEKNGGIRREHVDRAIEILGRIDDET